MKPMPDRRRFIRDTWALCAGVCWARDSSAQRRPADAAAVAPIGPGGPRWLRSKPLNEWIELAKTAVSVSSCATQADAGLTDAQCADVGYGHPHRGLFAYSGGALKKSGSEMLLFGGGGAGAWAGNDVRGLRLEDDQPTWRVRVRPARASNVPERKSPPTPYMLDGVTPNARHSYWTPQFIDADNEFVVFGCVNTWNSDSGQFYGVDSASLDTGSWAAPGKHPPIPIRRGWDGNWVCKHPITEDVYVSGASAIARWSPATNTWSAVWSTTARTDVDRATAAIDPSGSGTLLRIGDFGAPNVPVAIDLGTGVATVASFSGPHADSVKVGAYYAAGLVFDPGLARFLLFQDDGHLYGITQVTPANWSVDRLPLTGKAPEPARSNIVGRPALWGRMQYVPDLKGVCIIQAYDRPAYFVKTS